MRWFVEVAAVGESTEIERYCLEARQWQTALQEARKLRGDAGPLSKLSIEMMAEGYRAIDPKLRLRYLVLRAPGDSPLGIVNGGGAKSGAAAPAAAAPAAGVPAPLASADAAPDTTAPAPPASTETAPPTEAMSSPPVQSSGPAPRAAAAAPPAASAAGAPAAERSASRAPTSARPTQVSAETPDAPAFTVVRKREEEPTASQPITYREYAYAVDPATPLDAARVLLWARFREVEAAIAAKPSGKFVQLAVFDHVFERKPQRAPLITLAWKDWRGEPVVQVPSMGRSEPPPSSTDFGAPPSAPFQPPPSAPHAAPPPAPESLRSPAIEVTEEAPVSEATARLLEAPSQPPAAAPASERGSQRPSARMAAVRKGKRRHGEGEDLIGELFETMHELHFVPDVVSGAEFVLRILESTLPSEVAIVHVFDINAREFVVVRASGAVRHSVLLVRTRDDVAPLRQAMRRQHALAVEPSAADERFSGGRWSHVTARPQHLLYGPVNQGGRYLGLIELANPEGGGPYHQNELNALDYICEQFAELLAARPIVIDAEVVLAEPAPPQKPKKARR
ncbi:MAG: GAF domain-containing protein [Polyangiaceae bacterium]|nr:GAF domain-containing protein [Polyangiaceae bacterium]